MKTLNAHRFAVTPYVCIAALAQSGLKWAMPLAQHLALEQLALCTPIEITHATAKAGDGKDLFSILPPLRTLCGLPSILDETLPPDVIELRREDDVLFRIESLAIPCSLAT
jgi:hypothetical protein